MPLSKKDVKKTNNRKATAKQKNRKLKIFVGSGNVFKDLGRTDEEATNLMMRSVLMSEIEKIIEENAWTQERAAKTLKVARPRIAELCSGRIDLFSIDTLIKYINRLGRRVTLCIDGSEVA